MGINRHHFMQSQRWAFKAPPSSQLTLNKHLKSQQTLFEGYCCFQLTSSSQPPLQQQSPTQSHTPPSQSTTDSQPQQQQQQQLLLLPQFIRFETNEKLRDHSAMTCTITLLTFHNTNNTNNNNKNNNNSNVNITFLCVTIDDENFVIDHTQMTRIIRPIVESHIASISFVFDHSGIALRIYSMNNSESQQQSPPQELQELQRNGNALQLNQGGVGGEQVVRRQQEELEKKQIEQLNQVLNELLSQLGFMHDINDHIRRFFSNDIISNHSNNDGISTMDTSMLLKKYSHWIQFLNELNTSYAHLFLNLNSSSVVATLMHNKKTSDVSYNRAKHFEQQLNSLCSLYLSSRITFSEVKQLVFQLVSSASGNLSSSAKVVGEAIGQQQQHMPHFSRKSDNNVTMDNNDQLGDFSSMIDQMEQDMEREIEQEVVSLFSFSNNRVAPSEEALKALDDKMNQASNLTKYSLLLSCLPQKHFHY